LSRNFDERIGFERDASFGCWQFNKLLMIFVAVGIAARLVRYLLRFPLWDDEAFLAVNIDGRSYTNLLKPLDYFQVAPPLFLWVESTIVKIFGFSEYALRIFPLVSSIAALLLFVIVARHLMQGVPLLLATAIFAVSYYPIRFGAEVKPYSFDLLASLCVFSFALAYVREPSRSRSFWALAAITPVILGLSYPSFFVVSGMSLGTLFQVWQVRSRSVISAYVAWNCSMFISFAIIFRYAISRQFSATYEAAMKDFWKNAFPPLTDPLAFIGWMFDVHAGRTFGYPIGGDSGGSLLTLSAFGAGAVWLARRQRGSVFTLLLLPFLLTFAAAVIRRYPYGESARVSQHLTPYICLLAGIGLWRLLRIAGGDAYRRGVVVVCTALLMFGGLFIARDLVRPFKKINDQRQRNFARWFWGEPSPDLRLACVAEDLQEPFAKQYFRYLSAAQYRCHSRIYGRHSRRIDPTSIEWGKVPLRCVLFKDREDSPRRTQAWIDKMSRDYRLVGSTEWYFYLGHGNKAPRVQIFDFLPLTSVGDRLHSPAANPSRIVPIPNSQD